MEFDRILRQSVQDRRVLLALAGIVGIMTGLSVGVVTDSTQRQLEQLEQQSRSNHPNLRPPDIIATPSRYRP